MNSTKSRKRILFLYSEPAGYFYACLGELQKTGCEIHVVRFKVNPEAPFKLNDPEGIHFYERDSYSRKELYTLITKINPDLIYCSGWIDAAYIAACKKVKTKIPKILALDNPWKGTLKQYLGTWMYAHLKKNFSHVWVPGASQVRFAEKLGFKPARILRGVYSADSFHFNLLEKKFNEVKKVKFPKRFLYVGRYTSSKGISELWSAFSAMQKESPSDWELICAGTGDMKNIFPTHPKIIDRGFIQPHEMDSLIGETGVFVLPSRYEPWGVVLHEFASAGFPLICSSAVGAAERFLDDGENGFSFDAGNITQLKNAMLKICIAPDDELRRMGKHSLKLSESQSPVLWASTLTKLLYEK